MNPESNNQLATLPQAALARNIAAPAWNALKEIYDNASDQAIALVHDYCVARKLDPIKKPVHIVPVWSNRRNAMVDTIWPSISEVRVTAMRTGVFAGLDEAKFGPILKQDIGSAKGFEFPEWCQVTVYRVVGGTRCPFPGPKIYFLEAYAPVKRNDSTPNAMWARKTWGQIEKCAEAAALRRAFPEESSYTAEEMAGRALESELDPGTTVVGGAAEGTPGTDPAPEATKRPPVPRRSKGAAGLNRGEVVVEAETPPTTVAPADPAPAPAATEAPPPPAAAPAPEPEPAPAAAPAAADPAPAPAAAPKADAPAWPRTARGVVTASKMADVKGNPKYTKVMVVTLGKGVIELPHGKMQLADLGRLVIDPEKPELQAWGIVGDRTLEFTIDEQPSSSNPEKKNKVITAITAAEDDLDL